MVNRCPSCKTVLSDLEVDHKEIHGKLYYIKYPLKNKLNSFVVVATTRPETMLGDTAVAVNPEDDRYKNIIGEELILPLTNRVIKIIGDKQVDKDFGTGAVKITPAHDPNDYDIALRHNLESVTVIDHDAKMTGPVQEKFIGLNRFECREEVIEDLKKLNLIEKEENYIHNVGHCHRCETMIEPDISKQWFLKTSEIAEPAIEAVEKNKVVFIPDKWKKVYFNWMFNIKDWCISRQLWWGHRIPAYYCSKCGEIMVEEERPEKCSNCISTKMSQDEDVLDTWFSSALWPFSTLGWSVNSEDFKTYYPTSIMATGFDIIFFWVARMIMMGVHFTGEVPFREVLINGLIRDGKGQKMSKTKNNAVDPLDVIDKFGSDALRFTLAIQAVPGMDISFSMNRIKGYKTFANKIWNASRYVIMNLRGDEDFNIDFEKTTVTDKWILNFLNNIIEKVNDLMDNYRTNEAADLIYHFFWHEYCDWYLEFAKNDIDNIDTRKVLKFTLFRLLQLLHPFMPFITEEIYQKIKIEEDFLIQTKFPSFSSKMVFIDEYKDIELLKKIIIETRKTRTENRIDPNERINIYLKSESEKERKIISNLLIYFDFLTKSIKTEIKDDFSKQ
jgi:valyl-tRNA synthetase